MPERWFRVGLFALVLVCCAAAPVAAGAARGSAFPFVEGLLGDVRLDVSTGWRGASTTRWAEVAATLAHSVPGLGVTTVFETTVGEASRPVTLAFLSCRTTSVMLCLKPTFQAAVASAVTTETLAVDLPQDVPVARPAYALWWASEYRWLGTGASSPRSRGVFAAYVDARCAKLTGGLGHFVVAWLEVPSDLPADDFRAALARLWTDLRFAEPAEDTFEPFGRTALMLVPGMYADQGTGGHAAVRATCAAVATAGALAQVGKWLGRSERPNGMGPTSFPSSHTASAAAVAGAVGELHGNLRLPLLGLAALVGRSRVRCHHHRFADVVGGLALGYAAGRYWGRRVKDDERCPTLEAGGAGIVLFGTVRKSF